MRDLLISIAMLWIALSLFSCNTNTGSKDKMLNYKKIYDASISNGDYINAENAIYLEWASDPDTAHSFPYKDSLFRLYFKGKQYQQAILLGKEILSKKPDDLIMIGLIGDAELYINNLNEALDYFNIIYTKTHDLFTLYKIANVQFSLSQTNACIRTINQIILDTASAQQTIPITIGQGDATQKVPYKAVALNIRGVIAKENKQPDVAKKAFNDALAIDSAFVLAKNNLKDLNK